MPQGCAKKIQFQLLLADLPLKLRYPTRRGRRIVRGQRNRRRNGRAGVLFSRRSQCRICRHSRGLSCFSWFAWFARLDQHRTRTASVTQRRRAASQIMALPAIQQRPLNIQFSSQCLHIRCGVHPRQSRKFEFTRVLSMSSPGHCSSPRTVWQISVSQFRGAVQDRAASKPVSNALDPKPNGCHFPANSCCRLMDQSTDVTVRMSQGHLKCREC